VLKLSILRLIRESVVVPVWKTSNRFGPEVMIFSKDPSITPAFRITPLPEIGSREERLRLDPGFIVAVAATLRRSVPEESISTVKFPPELKVALLLVVISPTEFPGVSMPPELTIS
jgi:hypothetical protein